MNLRTNELKHAVAAVKLAACLAAGLSALACAACSLGWRAAHDVPILMYAARLMVESHAVPYRDIFDMNLPATYWMMGGLVRFLGCSDGAVRFFDLALLGCILALTFTALRRWGRSVAALGICLFALRYFSGTWHLSLQREYLALLPLSAILAWMSRREPCSAWGGALLGFLFAWLALIKPQFVIFFVPVAVFVCGERPERRRLLQFGAALAAGFSVPLAGCVCWLIWQDAWRPFLELVTQYWPLYGQMSGTHEIVTGAARWRTVTHGALAMLCSWYVAAAFLGIAAWLRSEKASRPRILFWVAMLACSILLPCFSGQFWGYHKIPFFYVTLCLSALVFTEGAVEERPSFLSWANVGIGSVFVAAWMAVALPRSYHEAASGVITTEKQGVPDAVAAYLRARLVAGDRVQPLDWTGGAVHGMLMADALPATRFLYDFHFYHHVDSPVVQKLRHEFLSALESDPPRFMVEPLGQLRPSGGGTSDTFAEFEHWRAGTYHVAESQRGYRIWERNGQGGKRE